MKKLLAVLLLFASFACFAQDTVNPLDYNLNLYPVCTQFGLNPDSVFMRYYFMVLKDEKEFTSDNPEIKMARLYTLYAEWYKYGELAESLFTIQK